MELCRRWIGRAAQADGTMEVLSLEWFGTDYATAGAEFDVEALGQEY